MHTNFKKVVVNLIADNNVFGGHGSSNAYWGNITGNIDNQTDLIERLSHTYEVALSPNNWEFSDTYNMYVQTSRIQDIMASDNVVAHIKFSDNKITSEKEATYWNEIEKISVFDGYITVYIEEQPDITLNIVLKT